MTSCLHCGKMTSNPKFCCQSCAASFNNKGKRRHGIPKTLCLVCSRETRGSKSKYCSFECGGISKRKSDKHKRALNAARQSKYREKKYRQIHPTSDKQKIREIYINCPVGYEVDHIVPLSKGGLHHQDNLQYLLKEENRRKGNSMVESGGTAPPSDRYERPASL